MGLAAVASSNYRFLKVLFDQKVRRDSYKPEEPAAATLHNVGVLTRDEQRVLPGREREHTPLSNHLFEALREPLRESSASPPQNDGEREPDNGPR